MPRPLPNEYPVYFKRYIDQVPEPDLLTAFDKQATEIRSFLSGISEEKSTYAYAEDKWTIKQLLQHIIDAERIFCYRSLCFARQDKTNLPGFEENDYAATSAAESRSWESLIEEFMVVREASYLLFKSFNNEAMKTMGTANNNPVAVKSIGFIILGHYYHHKKILIERYL